MSSLFFLLINLVFSKTEGDLVPPFIPEKTGDSTKVSYWQLSGHSIVSTDKITLIPPLQFSMGSCWTNLEIPDVNWKISYNLSVIDATGESSIALWFIDEFGSSGPINGGPEFFKGIGVLLNFKKIALDKIKIEYRLLQNRHTIHYNHSNLSAPDKIEFLPHSEFMIVSISFSNGKIIVTQDSKEILQEKVIVDIKNSFIGSTAKNDRSTMIIELNSITFEVDKKPESSWREVSDIHTAGHYDPENIFRFRSPRFNLTSDEIAFYEDTPERLGTAEELLEVISEINFAAFDAASYSELNYFIDQTITPYAQKWQKRMYKTSATISEAQDILSEALHYTKDLIKGFNKSMDVQLKKAGLKFSALEELMKDEAVEGPNVIVIDFSQNTEFSSFNILLYVSFIEILLLILFVMTFRNESFGFPIRIR